MLAVAAGCATTATHSPAEAALEVIVPPGVRVVATELDGPVFADAQGLTLYRWPQMALRNGTAGDPSGTSFCLDRKTTVNAGLMSPYPPGLALPDVDTRPSCAAVWPPFRAAPAAKPVGKWSIIERADHVRQWAYEGAALYTSVLDRMPGDVFGGSSRKARFDGPAVRVPVSPPPDVPPGLRVVTTSTGRLLVTDHDFSVYSADQDPAGASACEATCTQQWPPITAAASATAHGDWSVILRRDGVRQWAYRRRALYRRALDSRPRSQTGSDVAGWHNVYTQRAPAPPPEFTVQDTTAGQVLADARGMTIYVYACGDDAEDQLACDHPTTPQAYRFAMCGGGDPDRCLRNFPYVPAPKDARPSGRSWRPVDINPRTGRFAKPGEAGSVHVWAYRDRPVYTYAGDRQPGDINADSHGEFRGERNGFKAFWIRDDFYDYAG